AGAGGGAAGGAEAAFTGEDVRAGAVGGAVEQAFFESFGIPVTALARMVLKRAIGGRVGENALKAFRKQARHTRELFSTQLVEIQNHIQAVGREAAQTLRIAKKTAGEATEAAKAAGQDVIQAVRDRFGAQLSPPTPGTAGKEVGAVFSARTPEGAVQSVRTQLGRAVGDAAETGPDVDLREAKAFAKRVLEEELEPPEKAFPRQKPRAVDEVGGAGFLQGAGTRALLGADVVQQILADAAEAEVEQVVKHPAMGVLSRFFNAADEVSFGAAHIYKMQLAEALKTPVEQTARTRVDALTRGMRDMLREAMASHEPYNAATRRFERFMKTFERADGEAIRAAAILEPGEIVRKITVHEPEKLLAIRELLLEAAPQGGGEAEGRAAWNAFTSSWIHERIGKGSVDKLAERLAKLDPDVRALLDGDEVAGPVLRNLKDFVSMFEDAGKIADGLVRDAIQQGAQRVENAEVTGALKVQHLISGAGGRQAFRAAGRETRRAEADVLLELAESTVSARTLNRPIEAITADAARFIMLGPAQIWGAISGVRLIRGPKGNDLVRWASHSSANTQLLVRAIAGPEAHIAMAALLRQQGIGAFLMDPSADDLEEFIVGAGEKAVSAAEFLVEAIPTGETPDASAPPTPRPTTAPATP
ncbi:hypothetical protein LCGC14_2146720, partial [marine sediment metagenome]